MEKQWLKILIIGLILFSSGFYSPVEGQTGYAGMPGGYLHMGVGAQALSMGKAYTALANDATAIYWNPAGLADQNPFQFYLMHSTLFLDTNLDYFAASAPTEKFGSFGLGVMALSSKGFDQRNLLNEELGDFNTMDMAFFLSWSKEAYFGISFGMNYKLVSQKILSYSGLGHGIDLGFKKQLFDRVDLGLMLANAISPKMTLVEESEEFARQLRFGVASKFMNNKLVVSTEISQIFGWGSTNLNFGVEYQAMRNVSVRTGMTNGQFTVGVGLSLNEYGFDYSSANVSELGTSHRFAVKYAFGGFGVKASANPDIFSPHGEINISHIRLNAKSRSEIYRWVLEIVDETGQVVRQFAADGNVPEEIVWDGRDNNGSLVTDGKFKYKFDVVTADGKLLNAEGMLVTIDTKGPVGTLATDEND